MSLSIFNVFLYLYVGSFLYIKIFFSKNKPIKIKSIKFDEAMIIEPVLMIPGLNMNLIS